MAVDVLWMLSGRLYGECEETIRPCFGPSKSGSTYAGNGGMTVGGAYYPGMISMSFLQGGCGCSHADCSCVGPSEVALPGPVAHVTEVMIDGDVLSPALYRVRNSRWLLRIDGKAWPQAQDLTVPDNAEGAFTVKYGRGIPVPAAGLLAAGDLACELLKARTGGRCSIPSRAQSIARQGVNIELADVTTLFTEGLTGVSSVDRWLVAVNPNRSREPSAVFSVDNVGRGARFS
jgi:hypothetical protein